MCKGACGIVLYIHCFDLQVLGFLIFTATVAITGSILSLTLPGAACSSCVHLHYMYWCNRATLNFVYIFFVLPYPACSLSRSSTDEYSRCVSGSRYLHSSHRTVFCVAVCQGSQYTDALHFTGAVLSRFTDQHMDSAGQCSITIQILWPQRLQRKMHYLRKLFLMSVSGGPTMYRQLLHQLSYWGSSAVHVYIHNVHNTTQLYACMSSSCVFLPLCVGGEVCGSWFPSAGGDPSATGPPCWSGHHHSTSCSQQQNPSLLSLHCKCMDTSYIVCRKETKTLPNMTWV